MTDARQLDEVLAQAVDSGAVPAVVAVAADRDGIIYQGAAGTATPGGAAASAGTVFRIASMTKMITTAAALQQYEAGRFGLDDPVDKYLPDFGGTRVLDGFDGDQPRYRPPATRPTVRQLITHTAGFGYWFWNADLVRWEKATGNNNVIAGDASALTAPLVHDPGTAFEYGLNVDWLGRVVEAVSGEPLDGYVRGHITGPLGMTDTSFLLGDEQRANSIPIYLPGEGGGWVPSQIDWNQRPYWWAGGHGLYSTPSDYLRFQRALLGGGALDGVQILRQETVAQVFVNQIGDLWVPEHIPTADPASSYGYDPGPGHKWGLGLLLNTVARPGMRAAGSGSWAGLFNSHFWVDPATGVTAAIYSQFLPFLTPPSVRLYEEFERALYASL
jgi:CubicO group peptidase (beta-lactamase class C family)